MLDEHGERGAIAMLRLSDQVRVHVPSAPAASPRFTQSEGCPTRKRSSRAWAAWHDPCMQHADAPPRGGLRRRVLDGETTIGAFIQLANATAADVAARVGLDWLIVDLEHGHGGEAELLGQLHPIQATATAGLVRVQSSERLRVGRALDLGADGLMIPRLETADDVREALAWMRFPPAGVRGVALTTRGAGYSTVDHPDVATINDRVLGVFQVESPRALDNADEIAAIDGVDCLFVGPADLSHAMGIPGRIDEPSFRAALDAVITACRGHGKAAGILLRGPSALPAALEQGFTFVGIGSDAGWLIAGATIAASEAREAVRGQAGGSR